jgi:predicted RNase H-like HicB family nuclease
MNKKRKLLSKSGEGKIRIMKTIQLKNVVWKEGKHFVAQCLNVDVSSFGESKEEALKNLDEALSLYFQDNDKHRTS